MIKDTVKDIFLVAGVILSMLVTLVLFSSQKELSVSENASAYVSSNISKSTEQNVNQNNILVSNEKVASNPNNSVGLISSEQYFIRHESAIEAEMKTTDIHSNYTQNGMNIVWYTEAPMKTDLRLGIRENVLNRMLIDEDIAGKHYIHNVRVEPLTSGTKYYYSGSKAFIQEFTFPSIEVLEVQQSINLQGTINRSSDECIIKVQFERNNLISSPITTIANNGNWLIDVSGTYTNDFKKLFLPNNSDNTYIDFMCINRNGNKSVGSIERPLGEIININISIDL